MSFRHRLVGRAEQLAGYMPNYPADFTVCACSVRNFSGVACGKVKDLGRNWRQCQVCGAQWTGDFKRHANLPPVPNSSHRMTYSGRVK